MKQRTAKKIIKAVALAGIVGVSPRRDVPASGTWTPRRRGRRSGPGVLPYNLEQICRAFRVTWRARRRDARLTLLRDCALNSMFLMRVVIESARDGASPPLPPPQSPQVAATLLSPPRR